MKIEQIAYAEAQVGKAKRLAQEISFAKVMLQNVEGGAEIIVSVRQRDREPGRCITMIASSAKVSVRVLLEIDIKDREKQIEAIDLDEIIPL